MHAVEYLEKLKEDKIPRITVFYGEEDYWVNAGLSALGRLLFSGEEEANFNRVEAVAGDLEEETLFNLLQNPPFFSAARLVIIRRMEGLKAALDEEFLKAVDPPAAGVYLALTAEQWNQRRKLLQTLKKKAAWVECHAFKPHEARKWIMDEAKRMNFRISPETAWLLVEYRGTSPASLKNELEKAVLYAGGRPAGLTREEWLALLGRSTESGLFTMLDQVTEGRTGESLQSLHQLLDSGEAEIKLLFMLSRQVRLLLQIFLLRQAGRNREEISKELGCHPYVVEKLLPQAAKMSLASLRAAHRRLVQADFRIKTGQSPPRLELEMLVCDLSALAKKK